MSIIRIQWNEERASGRVIWPYRFRFRVLKVIDHQQWQARRIDIREFGLVWQRGFQQLGAEHSAELMQRFQNSCGLPVDTNVFTGTTIISHGLARENQEARPIVTAAGTEANLTHRDLQETIAEIGTLQFYYTQLEYPIELPGEERNLDVVWRREISGVPTYAFEIELSGSIETALLRLRYAFNQWNSRPRIIVPARLFQRVNNVAASQDRMFFEQLRMYEPEQVVSLLKRKRELRDVENELGIY